MNYNKIVLVGRLANDPELKYTPSGIAVSSFRLAVNRPPRQGETESEADFINIVAWRQSAEFAASYLSKGRLVLVDGRLQIRKWKAQDGSPRSTAEVVADRLQAMERLRDAASPPPQEPAEQKASDAEQPADLTSDLDDPFADE
jgi:single-strand DNA-binding protein